MLIFSGTVGAGATAEIQLAYLPQFLQIFDVTTATANLNEFTVNVNALGTGVITDINDGSFVRDYGCYGSYVNQRNQFNLGMEPLVFPIIQLSNGIFGNQNTVIQLRNLGANPTAVNIYGYSTQKGTRMYKQIQQRIYQNSGVTVSDFDYLGLKPLPNNVYNVTFADGTSQSMTNSEFLNLLNFLNYPQTNSNFQVENIILDNTSQWIQSINIIPSADTNILIVNQ